MTQPESLHSFNKAIRLIRHILSNVLEDAVLLSARNSAHTYRRACACVVGTETPKFLLSKAVSNVYVLFNY